MDAREFLPPAPTLDTLREAARACRGCPLWRGATQTVFGEGPGDSRLMLVGGRPDVDDDRAGEPFVGGAGRVLSRAIEAAGLARDEIYVTYAVKHFKRDSPGRREIAACIPWLEKEIELVRPEVVVCLGATASKALREASASRGVPPAIATVDPSSILRHPTPEGRRRELQRLADDLRTAARLIRPARSA